MKGTQPEWGKLNEENCSQPTKSLDFKDTAFYDTNQGFA